MKTLRIVESVRASEIPESLESFLAGMGGPTLFLLQGHDPSRTRAVCTLTHGDEPSGVRALHAWLRRGESPATNAAIFVVSVEAALEPPVFSHRHLPGHRDLNRCFVAPFDGAEGERARSVLELLERIAPETLVDIHNTSGSTPAYGMGPRASGIHLNLANFFADRYVCTSLRLGTLVEATSPHIPGIVVECGSGRDPAAEAVARRGLADYLAAEAFPSDAPPYLEVFGNPVRVRVTRGLDLAFSDGAVAGADLTVKAGIDRLNLVPMPAGEILGWVAEKTAWPLEAIGADGVDISRDLFEIRGRTVLTRREVVPVMMTTQVASAVGDCLFYAVDRVDPCDCGT